MRFEKKDFAALVPATLIAIAGLGPDDPWIIGLCLLLSWGSLLFICSIHDGSKKSRAAVAAVITLILGGVAYRRLMLPSEHREEHVASVEAKSYPTVTSAPQQTQTESPPAAKTTPTAKHPNKKGPASVKGVGSNLVQPPISQGGAFSAFYCEKVDKLPSGWKGASNCQDIEITDNHVGSDAPVNSVFENAGKAERVDISGSRVAAPPNGSAHGFRNLPGGVATDITAHDVEVGSENQQTPPTPTVSLQNSPGSAVSYNQEGGITAGTINIARGDRNRTENQGQIFSAFYADLAEAVRVLVKAPRGDEAGRFGGLIRDALTMKRKTFVAWDQSMIPNLQPTKGLFIVISKGRINIIKKLCEDLVASQLSANCYEDQSVPDNWIYINVGDSM